VNRRRVGALSKEGTASVGSRGRAMIPAIAIKEVKMEDGDEDAAEEYKIVSDIDEDQDDHSFENGVVDNDAGG
jgi:hypothetical protein